MCTSRPTPTRGLPRGEPSPLSARGFTFLEAMVVLALLSILFAISAPMLARSRTTARDHVRLSAIRQAYTSLSIYSADHDQQYPFLAQQRELLDPLTIEGEAIPFGYFRQSWLWATAIVPDYFDARSAIEPEEYRAFAERSGFPDDLVLSRITMTYGAFTDPDYWNDDLGPESWAHPTHLRPGRTFEVRYPAQKAILTEGIGAPTDIPGPWPVATGDGSARLINELIGFPTVFRPAAGAAHPMLSTPDGLAGRDFR